MSTNSLHPGAAVGKRLFTGQVKNQAHQRQLAPLQKASKGFTWNTRYPTSNVSCKWKNSREAFWPFFRRTPLTAASLQSQSCRAPGGERHAVIQGDLEKLHGFKLSYFFLAKALIFFFRLQPHCKPNTDEQITVLNVWKDLVPHGAIDSYSHHPPSVIQGGATVKSGVLNNNWTHHAVAGLWDVHTFH